MNDKVKETGSSLDALKWLVVLVLVVAGVYGNSYFASASVLNRTLALLVLAAIAAYIAGSTAKGKSFIAIGKDARTEIRKVVWPTRQETIHTSLIVVAMVGVMAVLLWILDSLISWLISLLIGG